METKKVILLATEADTTNILYHKLNEVFGVTRVLLEQKVSAAEVIKRRVKKQGLITAAGQVLFKLIIQPVLRSTSTSRLQQIINGNHLNNSPIPADKIKKIGSINSEETIRLLQQLKPDLIIVHGTRILSSGLLENVPCKFMNIHAGITPKYRGVHGGYWALANNDPLNCGVTVHFIDKGIDTGDIIAQDTIQPTSKDNFYTYPYLQLAKGIELLTRSIDDHFEGKLICKKPVGENVLRHYPTFWQYLYNRWSKKVK